jgi:hypothetical protein
MDPIHPIVPVVPDILPLLPAPKVGQVDRDTGRDPERGSRRGPRRRPAGEAPPGERGAVDELDDAREHDGLGHIDISA